MTEQRGDKPFRASATEYPTRHGVAAVEETDGARRSLLKAGWVTPVVLSMTLPRHAQATSHDIRPPRCAAIGAVADIESGPVTTGQVTEITWVVNTTSVVFNGIISTGSTGFDISTSFSEITQASRLLVIVTPTNTDECEPGEIRQVTIRPEFSLIDCEGPETPVVGDPVTIVWECEEEEKKHHDD